MSTVRRRSKVTPTSGPGAQSTGPERVKAMIIASADKAPPGVRPYIHHLATAVAFVMVAWDTVAPYLAQAWAVGKQVYEMMPEDLLMALLGLLMCFFGGTFSATIAAVEAFKMTGWEQTKKSLQALHEDYLLIKEANEKDEQADKDADGVADVNQKSGSELLAHKLHLVLVSVKDPEKVSSAIVGIGSSCLSVLAVLRVQFAKTITLAVSIGNNLKVVSEKYATPAIKAVCPDEYDHWIPTVVNYICKSIAIAIAWYIQKVISAIHSGIRGGLMFSRNTMNYLNKRGMLSLNHEDTQLDEYVGWALAGLGVYFQVRYGFSLPFPLNILLLPISMLEWVIIWMVSDTDIQLQ